MVQLKKINPLENCCENCSDYNLVIDGRSKCLDNHNMEEMKKKGYPCYASFSGVLSSYNTKDEFDNVGTEYK
jgi:hypothetical protein